MEKRKYSCKCVTWVRFFDEELLSNHAPGCPNRNIEVEAKIHLCKILEALEYEARIGDGISEDFSEAYESAKYFVGQYKTII